MDNKPLISVCDFSRDGCLKFLSSIEAAKQWRAGELDFINRHAEKLLPEFLPEYRKKKTDFVKVDGLGGEAVVIRGFDKICQRETIFKVAFPDANLKGIRTVYQGENPRRSTVEHFNIVRERYIRGGAQICGALSDIINRKYGVIPQVRTACDFPVYVEMEFLEGFYPLTYYKDKDFREVFNFFYRLLVLVSIVHSYQIIHRDFKPSNIMVLETEDGCLPAILDWTFSKQMNFNSSDDETMGLTQSSNMNFHIHSPCFSSPRLIEGDSENADFQDDIYSLGQIMYCLFTGTRPRTLKDFITREKPILAANGVALPATKLPAGSVEIYKKATALDENERYKTVSDFILDLEKFAYEINIDFPQVDVPGIISNNEGFDEFEGTRSKQTPKKSIEYRVEEPTRKTLIVDLSKITDEQSREMVKNIVQIAVLSSKNNVIIDEGTK